LPLSAFRPFDQPDSYLSVVLDRAKLKFYFDYCPNDDRGIVDRTVVDQDKHASQGNC
jgi:hypothetical protein